MTKSSRIVNVTDKFLRGWLPCKSINGKRILVPYFSLVKNAKHNSFVIVNGLRGSISLEIDFDKIKPRLYSNYIDKRIVESTREFKLSLTTQTLTYIDRANKYIEIKVITNSLSKGLYTVEFPVLTNIKLSRTYFNENLGGSRFADTWFPIKLSNRPFENRFLHLGTISSGCITVMPDENNVWNKLFFDLLESNRANLTLGTIIVTD